MPTTSHTTVFAASLLATWLLAGGQLCLAPTARADSEGQLSPRERSSLRGFIAARIAVEDYHEPAGTACGLRKSSLELAVAKPLVDGGVKVDTKPKLPSLYVKSSVAQDVVGERVVGCSAHIAVSAEAAALGELPHQPGTKSQLRVQLWEESSFLGGPTGGFGERVNETAQRQCLGTEVAQIVTQA